MRKPCLPNDDAVFGAGHEGQMINCDPSFLGEREIVWLDWTLRDPVPIPENQFAGERYRSPPFFEADDLDE